MELKLTNDEENDKKTGGLRLPGASEQQGMGIQQEQENPWDFDKPEEPIITRSISDGVTAGSNLYSSSVGDVHIVVKLGRIIVYACMLFMIISMIWVGTQPKINSYSNFMKFSPFYSVCEGLLVMDAILVNVLYERKISLVVWAWLLGFAYPIRRDKHVNGGSMWGGLTCVGLLMATVAFMANFMVAFTDYGATIMNEDEAIRTAVVAFMEHTVSDGGENFGSKLKRNLQIQNVDVETQGNQSVVVVQGNGQYGANTDSFIDYTSKTVATQLAFVKDSSGNYKLGAVMLGNIQLSNQNVNYYWNTLMK